MFPHECTVGRSDNWVEFLEKMQVRFWSWSEERGARGEGRGARVEDGGGKRDGKACIYGIGHQFLNHLDHFIHLNHLTHLNRLAHWESFGIWIIRER